jgi:hypothetical protein
MLLLDSSCLLGSLMHSIQILIVDAIDFLCIICLIQNINSNI